MFWETSPLLASSGSTQVDLGYRTAQVYGQGVLRPCILQND